jgi:hypothetical protein
VSRRKLPLLEERIESCIFLIRGERVMFSTHLAELYEVQTKALMQAVKRNLKRFPEDFMFQLTWEETDFLESPPVVPEKWPEPSLRSQIVTLKRGKHVKYLPCAFTKQGVAVLSGVLRSDRAISVNIGIMRAFVRLRRMLAAHADLARRHLLNESMTFSSKPCSMLSASL